MVIDVLVSLAIFCNKFPISGVKQTKKRPCHIDRGVSRSLLNILSGTSPDNQTIICSGYPERGYLQPDAGYAQEVRQS